MCVHTRACCFLISNFAFIQAYKANVICPNKHQSDPEKFYNNRLLESETYIGGHVECLESGVFRSDLPTSFKLDPSAYEVCCLCPLPIFFHSVSEETSSWFACHFHQNFGRCDLA